MANQDNLAFWNSVEQTDDNHTKHGDLNGQLRTFVRAQYKKKMITKQFGMYGKGWGILPNSEKYERIEYPNTGLLIYTATAFYVLEGKQYEFPIASSVKEFYVTKNGNGYAKIDDEAVKKVRTDAVTKGFTELGFNADVFLGMWEDADYIQGIRLNQEIQQEEEQTKSAEEAIAKIKEWSDKEIEAIDQLNSLPAYLSAMRTHVTKIRKRCAAAKINSAEFQKHVEELVQARKDKEVDSTNEGENNES